MKNLEELIKNTIHDVYGSDWDVDVKVGDNSYSIKMTKKEDELLKFIKSYKDNLDLLDDCLFMDVMDELADYNINLKKFDELLNQDEFTEDEKECVLYLIGLVNSLITKHIEKKLQELEALKLKF